MIQKGLGRFYKTRTCILVGLIAAVIVMCLGPTMKDHFSLHLEDVSRTFSNVSHFETTNVSAKANTMQAITMFTRSKQEVTHIGFLKVHKAASSTMQNMFFRFGLKRNLTFVFTNHPNYFSRSMKNHLPLVKPKYRTGYDVLCNHGVFNYNIYSSLLPNDTVYLAIVRDPLDVFISGVNYYSQKSQQIAYISRISGNRIQKLIQKPEVYDRDFFSYTKNSMARDFGFLPTNDKSRVQTKLDELNNVFKLVLIVEHFEESLILMKRYLNWKLQDVLFLSNNVYGKGQSVSDLSPGDIAKFKVRNNLDYTLYNFFYKNFWDKFRAEADDLKLEVQHFKEVLRNLKDFCDGKTQTKALAVDHSRWSEKFTVSIDECKLMAEDELKFITMLRQKQGSELR